ncbi:hypothetical protein FLAG1_10098 [Fusarium langsethiae]|uniref:DUF7587 domain-containing protein n=1 Tax=Fusarium langsethiae TaxID=179993 RepID=A0A0M9EPA8_FUSLA|nr:hypothetical protein FLAG1_10098 [Fusarium langsethiae]GKU08055.1 unnamed protein product [Fusarium langsethiae]GKU09154.1 unnamed protein product [Fusarium langsethiae]
MASLHDLDRQVGGLSIADNSNGHTQSQTLAAALKEFDQTADLLKGQLADIKELLSDNTQLIGDHEEKIHRLYRRVRSLRITAKTFNGAVAQSVIKRITTSVGGRRSDTTDMLKHFNEVMKKFVHDSLSTIRRNDSLWRIAEKCYNEAVAPSGQLSVDDYITARSQSGNNQNPEEDQEEQRVALEKRKNNLRERWVRFWATCLSNCPEGPTLFMPPESTPFKEEMPPKYLFRAYDSKSWGNNTSNIIASEGYLNSRVDIFSPKRHNPSGMLYGHLIGPYTSTRDGNLVSWSSSLMFVIQCANYRCYQNSIGVGNVYICAVDTTKFPKRQFVRDKYLMQRFPGSSEEEVNFHRFRFNNPDYDNGEYLSQGILNLQGRSCTMSLENLETAGFGSLYSKLDVSLGGAAARAGTPWANYVKDLRWTWQDEYTSASPQLGSAIKIAQKCVTSFDKTDMALLLLAFRNRKLKNTGKL